MPKQTLDRNTVAKMAFIGTDGVEFTLDLLEELAMSEQTLNQDLLGQPGKYAWWASVAQQTKEKLAEANLRLEMVQAGASNKVRTDYASQGGKAPSQATIMDNILTDPNYLDARKDVNWWTERVGMLTYIMKSFEQRSNALAQIGAQIRREKDNMR